jgi:autophagy-related protein 2
MRHRGRAGKIRLRLHDASVNINLHDGYDYPRTRKLIEDEIRAVRRRLEKIRQLLASGQKADSSIESEATSMLFNSIYIGIEPHKLDSSSPAGLLAAIDEELNEDEGEVQTQSSWQTDFPTMGSERERVRKSSTVRLKGRRLTRSKKAQMEVVLRGVKVEVDVFGGEDEEEEKQEMASRVEVVLGSVEVLDHIKSSTWKKFLMEMKADSRGNVRETDAVMVRVEMVGVRPMKGADVEMRLRVSLVIQQGE